MEQESEQLVLPTGWSVGSSLKASRDAHGIGLMDVAARLKLSIRQIEAIERDDFKSLPSAVFVRGFVRNYARFLRIDPGPLMQALDIQFPPAVNDVANIVRDDARVTNWGASLAVVLEACGFYARRRLVVLLLAVFVTIVVWLGSNHSGERRPRLKRPAAILSEASTKQTSQLVPPTLSSLETLVVPLGPVRMFSQGYSGMDNLSRDPIHSVLSRGKLQEPPVNFAVASGKLALTVKKKSAWVSVVDATGKKLVSQIFQAGNTQEVVGTPPFKLVIGNAFHVVVNFNGQPVDLSDKIRGSTAKFELK